MNYAIQWDGHNIDAVMRFLGDYFMSYNSFTGKIYFNTSQGAMVASIGDWITEGAESRYGVEHFLN